MARRNITLLLDQQLPKLAGGIATLGGLSVSPFLAKEFDRATARDDADRRAKATALTLLDSPFPLGGRGMTSHDALHDRKSLR